MLFLGVVHRIRPNAVDHDDISLNLFETKAMTTTLTKSFLLNVLLASVCIGTEIVTVAYTGFKDKPSGLPAYSNKSKQHFKKTSAFVGLITTATERIPCCEQLGKRILTTLKQLLAKAVCLEC
uniref:Uncharacterized protein n=1 Tax=Glossina austeni TaxID=7395 RepID=A0A1A9VV51_GLOAU